MSSSLTPCLRALAAMIRCTPTGQVTLVSAPCRGGGAARARVLFARLASALAVSGFGGEMHDPAGRRLAAVSPQRNRLIAGACAFPESNAVAETGGRGGMDPTNARARR